MTYPPCSCCLQDDENFISSLVVGRINNGCFCLSFQYNYNTGISYESLGPDEVRSLLTTVRNFQEQEHRSALFTKIDHLCDICFHSNVG